MNFFSEMPLVSVIVPVFNEEKSIAACLESLLAQDLPKNAVEILVVDNGSTDRSSSIIQSYPVHYLFEPIRNRARARNRALEKAQGRYLAFLDGDCTAAPNWLRLLADGFRHDRVGGCGGEFIFPKHGSWIEKALYSDQEVMGWRHEALIRGKPWPALWTGNAIYDTKVLERIGFFDESLSDCEDLDLGWRASLAGYELGYVPEAHVSHAGLAGLRAAWTRIQEIVRGYQHLCHKYRHFFPSSQRIPKASYILRHGFFYSSASLFWFLKRPQGSHWRAQFLYSLYALAVLTAILLTRKSVKIYAEGIGTRILNERNFPELKPVIWWRDCKSHVVIYRSREPQFWMLNETASRMWCLLQERKTISEVAEILASEFETVPEQVEEDLRDWFRLLLKENLLGVKEAAADGRQGEHRYCNVQ